MNKKAENLINTLAIVIFAINYTVIIITLAIVILAINFTVILIIFVAIIIIIICPTTKACPSFKSSVWPIEKNFLNVLNVNAGCIVIPLSAIVF